MTSGLNRRQFALAGLRGLASCGLGAVPFVFQGCGEFAGSALLARPFPAVPIGAVSGADAPYEWRTLQRLCYGPQPGLFDRICRIGAGAFIEEQLAPDQIVEDEWLISVLEKFTSLGLSADEAAELETFHRKDQTVTPIFKKLLQLPLRDDELDPPDGPVSAELPVAGVLRAAFSRRQLKEMMVEFWSDHFNIFQRKGECLWLKTVDDRLIRTHALGHFRDLLRASATSPAMLVYLDNTRNRLTGMPYEKLNENYARELLELHTLGVDGGYVLRDIQEVARCLSGWGVRGRSEFGAGEFRFDAMEHDNASKVVLGREIPAGGGIRDGERVLEIISEHPSTARFIARKLCRRFIGDGQYPDLAGRLALVFQETQGHIGSLMNCLLHSSEFQDPMNVKFKRPFDYVVSALRALNVSTTGESLVDELRGLGQTPFGWPLPDGYPDTMLSWKDGLLGRWNFAARLVGGQLENTTLDSSALVRATETKDRFLQIQRLATYMTGSPLPKPMARGIADLLREVPESDAESQMLALILSSESFQWRG